VAAHLLLGKHWFASVRKSELAAFQGRFSPARHHGALSALGRKDRSRARAALRLHTAVCPTTIKCSHVHMLINVFGGYAHPCAPPLPTNSLRSFVWIFSPCSKMAPFLRKAHLLRAL